MKSETTNLNLNPENSRVTSATPLTAGQIEYIKAMDVSLNGKDKGQDELHLKNGNKRGSKSSGIFSNITGYWGVFFFDLEKNENLACTKKVI